MTSVKLQLLALALCHVCHAWFYGRPDPGLMTTGGVWPQPVRRIDGSVNHTLDPTTFRFVAAAGSGSDILEAAFKRYFKWTFPDYKSGTQKSAEKATVQNLTVTVNTNTQPTGYPSLKMDESYLLVVYEYGTATLQANTVWGALRGLDTFSQIVYQPSSNVYRVRATIISDAPRFTHRGIMIDSARHFLSVSIIKRNLDVMEQNKMNVMHWHLVDSESFPYTSTKYPDMSLKGAYTPAHRYTVKEMQDVVEYARLRGIRVVGEFDTPGHMGAWGAGFPGLLAQCYDSKGKSVLSNIIDPSIEANFEFLENFFKESFQVFPDAYMHFGGDETSEVKDCWLNNPRIDQWMKDHNFGDSTRLVLEYYFGRLYDIVKNASSGARSMLVWSEMLINNVKGLKSNLMADVWIGGTYAEMMNAMAEITAKGYETILSSCWYLNYIKYGADWGYVDNSNKRLRGMYYECDPTNFTGTEEQKRLVLGGEASMWGEFVDGTNLIPRLWPRASAVAERLWSSAGNTKSADEAWPRLHEHRCRMMRRGFQVQPPNDPDYCPTFWNPDYPNPDDY